VNEPAVFDPLAIIGTLNRHGVRFVVIGGIAAGVQGVVWATADLDVCYARSGANVERLAEALAELAAEPAEAPPDDTITLDARTLRNGDWWTLTTKFGRLDCLGEPAPGISYETIAKGARVIRGSETYQVAAFEDLLTMKRAANRPKDVGQIELLRAAIEESRDRQRD
jgi:hypothetical protein